MKNNYLVALAIVTALTLSLPSGTAVAETVGTAASTSPSIRERLRADLQKPIQNVKNNQDYRNSVLENRHGLDTALDNLKQIRARIESRIEKNERSGMDMASARALLAAADGKLTSAGKAIQTGGAAVKAIKDAQQSLSEVVQTLILSPAAR